MSHSHALAIDELESKVAHLYVSVEHEVPYDNHGLSGDIDLLALCHDGSYDVFKVKSSNVCCPKARKQLRRIAEYFRRDGRLLRNAFLYVADDQALYAYHMKGRRPGEPSLQNVQL